MVKVTAKSLNHAHELHFNGPEGCFFDDSICFCLSPGDLDILINEFKELALGSRNYVKQGKYRDLHDRFIKIYNEWHKMKDEVYYSKLEKGE